MVGPSWIALAEAAATTMRSFRAKKQALELTETAAERIKELLSNRHKVRVLSGITSCVRFFRHTLPSLHFVSFAPSLLSRFFPRPFHCQPFAQ